MIYRYMYISPNPVQLTPNQNYFQVTGLGLTYMNPAPSQVDVTITGDGTVNIWSVGITNITTDGFIVAFNTDIPNTNFTMTFKVI